MALTPEQRRNVAIANRLSSGHAPRVRLALLEAMGVESSFRNLNYGDRDSVGVLQQRKQYYPNAGKNVKYDIQQFLMRADRANKQVGGSAGQLAQAVQRSAFPGRYDEHAAEARSLLGIRGGGSAPAQMLGSPQAANGGVPGGYKQAVTNFLLDQSNRLAQGGAVDPGAALELTTLKQQYSDASPTSKVGQALGEAQPLMFGNSTQKERHALQTANKYLGTWYKWGGSNPKTGFDCSGLLQYSWGQSGVKIPRTTYDQWKTGRPVGKNQLHAGDAVFFEPSAKGPGHVGMYIGKGQFIEAPHTGAKVRVSTLAGRTDYMGARRYG